VIGPKAEKGEGRKRKKREERKKYQWRERSLLSIDGWVDSGAQPGNKQYVRIHVHLFMT
jgi:hypothetical protein